MNSYRAPRVDTEKHPNVSVFAVTDDFIDTSEKMIQSTHNVVTDYWKEKYEKDNTKNWDTFYKHNESKFFKDRHYLPDEFELTELGSDSSRPFHVVDMGCGVGNALLPMLHHFPNMTASGFDCSATAINLLTDRLSAENLTARCSARAGDMTDRSTDYSEFYGKADFVLLLFVMSAISPEHYEYITNLASLILKPGGYVLFRDYGKYDMAQLRFEAAAKRQGNRLGDGFYVRGDGTRAKFFSQEEIRSVWESKQDFNTGELVMHNKLFTNRKTQVEMKRIWIQGKWQKKL